MIKVPIVKWKKTAIYLSRTSIVCFFVAMTIIILGDTVNQYLKAFGILLVFPAFISLLILTFMNKSVVVGHLNFDKNVFYIESNFDSVKRLYEEIEKIDINNYDGQQFFSLKSINPFYDGLNNYIWISSPIKAKKIEVKITDKNTYLRLHSHFDGIRQQVTHNPNWKIKSLL